MEYERLPTVALTRIFSYLNVSDALNASSTCKTWRVGLLQYSPSLWRHYPLTIHLCNKHSDLKSSHFKHCTFSTLTTTHIYKFDANDLELIIRLAENLNSGPLPSLKRLTLHPIFNLYIEDEMDYDSSVRSIARFGQDILRSVTRLVAGARCIEHISLGFANVCYIPKDNLTLYKHDTPLPQGVSQFSLLLLELATRHSTNLRSLHLATCGKATSAYLTTETNEIKDSFQATLVLASLLPQFTNLTSLSIDFSHLSDLLIESSLFSTSLKKLNLNVNTIPSVTETQRLHRANAWLSATTANHHLRVHLNCLSVDDVHRKYPNILSTKMPLHTLRMFFCKALTPDLITYLSINYADTLVRLDITDAISEPCLRYHNPLRLDGDPDPLVLLCWRCTKLIELTVIGYELLEINLIAIAKLRVELQVFRVAMDCVIDLKYGKFRSEDEFVEDEDGCDTIVDYGGCSEHVIEKVSKILNAPDWHPLEKDELPLCIYDFDVPYEEAYLEILASDQ